MSNQLALQQAPAIPFSDMERMAQAIAKSGLFGIKSVDQAVALMLVAQSEGRHPCSVASEMDIIQGRPALKSQAALARFQAAGGKIQWLERNDRKASAEFSHPAGGTLVVTWTWERAEASGLTNKQTWRSFPQQLLGARVVAEGVRAVFPACLNGVYLAEEVADFTQSTPAAGKFQAVKASLKAEGHEIKSVSGLNPGERVTINVESQEPAVLLGPDEPEIQVIESPKVEKVAPLDQVYELADTDKLTEDQVLAFLRSKELINSEVEYLADVKETLLKRLVKNWPQVIEFAVGASMEEAA